MGLVLSTNLSSQVLFLNRADIFRKSVRLISAITRSGFPHRLYNDDSIFTIHLSEILHPLARSLLPQDFSRRSIFRPCAGDVNAAVAACQGENFPHVGRTLRQIHDMAASMQRKLALFLRQKRGPLSYPAFARKLGILSSSLHRMEMGEQNVTLKALEYLLKRLKCRAGDIFDR